jgi:hypothetical protein
MISGLTHPTNEFFTPYRVINYNICNGCWNDPTAAFDRHDFMSCPRHANTPRQFECTRLITADHVKAAIHAFRDLEPTPSPPDSPPRSEPRAGSLDRFLGCGADLFQIKHILF